MIAFDQWYESLIFVGLFAVIVLTPCVLVGLIGHKMITALGNYPSKTPFIQMSVLVKLVFIEICTFLLLIGFYLFFTAVEGGT